MSALTIAPPPRTRTAPSPTLIGVQSVEASLHRFSVERYQRMIAAGMFDEDTRLELLDGLVVEQMPRDPLHGATNSRLTAALLPALPAGWSLRIRDAVVMPGSQPEPDLAVVRHDADYYAAAPHQECRVGDRVPLVLGEQQVADIAVTEVLP